LLSGLRLAENSKENIDARLEHAIEEIFPTRGPISVIVTKKAVAEVPREAASTTSSSQGRDNSGEAEQDAAEKLLDQGREALSRCGTDAFWNGAGRLHRVPAPSAASP
jgi:hypothetical protein